MSAASLQTLDVAALVIIAQTSFKLLFDHRERDRLQRVAPVTACLIIILAAVATALHADVAAVDQLAMVDDTARLAAEPWRILSSLLAYERLPPLAGHLWILFRVGPRIEPRLGTRTFALLLAPARSRGALPCCC